MPTDTKGFTGKDQKGKLSLRASDTSELHLEDVHLPKDAILPKSGGLKSPLSCLTQARYGIAWGAIGAAMACYDEAVRYAKNRVMFDRPIGADPDPAGAARRHADRDHQGAAPDAAARPAQGRGHHDAGAGLARQAQQREHGVATCAREARRLLGANGILAEYHSMRHMANLESVYTYEGTHDMHSLILGQAITGLPAF